MQFKKHKVGLTDIKTGEHFTVDGHLMELGLYKIDIEFVIGQTKQVRRFFVPNVHGFVHQSDDTGSLLLWVKNTRDLSTLVHELYHLVNFISKHASLSDDDTNEQQAYLMGWLFLELIKIKK